MIFISNLYPDLTNSFPNEMDPNRVFSDVTLEAKPLVEQYYRLFDAGDFAGASKVLDDNPALKNMIINAPVIQYLYDMCISSQRFYLKDVQQYLVDIVKYRDEWSETSRYTKYDAVTYIQAGARETFMAIVKDIPIGTPPTNRDYYVPLVLRGEKGVSGTGLAPRGVWSIEANYYTNDLVAYKNKWYSAKRDNTQKAPKLISDDWEMILEAPQQFRISVEQPQGQTYGDIWGEVLEGSTESEPRILLHQMNIEGNYVDLYIKDRADMIKTNSGSNVENEIVHTYLHTKTGTVHNLQGTGKRLDFLATADFVEGDSFTVNGAAVQAVMSNGDKPGDSFFKTGNWISAATFQNGKLSFSSGGSGGGAVVSNTAPLNKKLIWVDTADNASVKFWNGSAWVKMNCGYADQAGNAANADTVDGKHATDFVPVTASCNRNWAFSGQGGQPSWLWGSNDGTNMLVYNPGNFSVAYSGNTNAINGTAVRVSGGVLQYHNGANWVNAQSVWG